MIRKKNIVGLVLFLIILLFISFYFLKIEKNESEQFIKENSSPIVNSSSTSKVRVSGENWKKGIYEELSFYYPASYETSEADSDSFSTFIMSPPISYDGSTVGVTIYRPYICPGKSEEENQLQCDREEAVGTDPKTFFDALQKDFTIYLPNSVVIDKFFFKNLNTDIVVLENYSEKSPKVVNSRYYYFYTPKGVYSIYFYAPLNNEFIRMFLDGLKMVSS